MTTWTSISNPAVAVGGIPSSTTVTALRDNPAAMAEAASGAPVIVAGWHPYDKIAVGDSNDGVIYDSVVNGTVADIVTPDFDDGYEYRLIASGLSHNNGSSTSLRLRMYFQTDAAYRTAYTTPVTAGSSTLFDMDAEILLPRVSRVVHLPRIVAAVDRSGVDAIGAASNAEANAAASADRVLRAQLLFVAGSVDAGKVWLLRRREYISSP
jgi:hypothetical protein